MKRLGEFNNCTEIRDGVRIIGSRGHDAYIIEYKLPAYIHLEHPLLYSKYVPSRYCIEVMMGTANCKHHEGHAGVTNQAAAQAGIYPREGTLMSKLLLGRRGAVITHIAMYDPSRTLYSQEHRVKQRQRVSSVPLCRDIEQ